ncbi:MAG: hypothetical protein ABSB78_13330 [Bacteroidota bacterium]
MNRKSIILLLIIIVSWGFEFLWIRYGYFFDFRLFGIHFIPLFLVPLISIWFLSLQGVNLINVLGRFGQIRLWFFSLFIPILIAGVSTSLMILLRLVRFSENVNVETRILGLIIDLPLNYVLWFPLLFSTEICWRGAFLPHSGKRLETIRRSTISSFLWILSLGGFVFLGYTERGFSFLTGSLSVTAFLFLGIYQSMIYRRSGSLLLSAFSLLCIILINSYIFELPLAGTHPLVEVLHPKSMPSTIGFFISSCLFGLTSIVMWNQRRDESARR